MAQHEERCEGCGDVVDEAEHCAYCGNAFCTACWQDTTEAGPVCFGCSQKLDQCDARGGELNLRTGSFCTGICAPEVAWHPLGWQPQFFSEIDPFACAVEAHRFPGVPNLGDMTKVDGSVWRGLVDVLVAGTPCQAFSVAGIRGSLSDARGNLTLTFCELVHAIDPLCSVTENVPGWLSTDDNAFGCFLAELVGAGQPLVSGREAGRWPSAGMVAGPKRSAAWRILDAQYLNLAQRRERVFVVSFRTGDGINPGAVLFEPESVPRHSPPSREEEEGIARSVTCRTGNGSRQAGGNGNIVPGRWWDGSDIAPTLDRSTIGKQQMMPDKGRFPCVTHSLRSEGHDASEDGTGRGVPLAVDTLTGNGDTHSGFPDHRELVPMTFGAQMSTPHWQYDLCMAVRRLMPIECERLQGFPDLWTLINYRGKPATDSPRYKALGNSMAVPVLRWIGERIEKVLNARGEAVRNGTA